MANPWKKIADSFDQVVRSESTAKTVSRVEDQWNKYRHRSKVDDGVLRGVRVIVYRGYVSGNEARVKVRVVEAPRLPGEESKIPYYDVVNANLRRHAVLAFPDVKVTATLADHVASAETDRHGFASLRLPAGRLAPGWHEVTAVVESQDSEDQEYVGVGRVLKTPALAPLMVVSDIDDTVLRTGLDEGIVALRRTLSLDAHSRRAVPGMASLYRGLSRGVTDADGGRAPEPGFFYVSTGSWAFYEMLTQFLQLRGYPRGPLFLTDWGPSERYLRRSGEQHKHETLNKLEAALPTTPMVLIGDSGQRDPDIYSSFARSHPGRVRLILIIKASDASAEKTQQWRDKEEAFAAEGIPFHVVDDALQAAIVAHDEGLVDRITIEEVETEMGALF